MPTPIHTPSPQKAAIPDELNTPKDDTSGQEDREKERQRLIRSMISYVIASLISPSPKTWKLIDAEVQRIVNS